MTEYNLIKAALEIEAARLDKADKINQKNAESLKELVDSQALTDEQVWLTYSSALMFGGRYGLKSDDVLVFSDRMLGEFKKRFRE